MTDYRAIENQLTSVLGLTRRPIAIVFADVPPASPEKFEGTEPSGCSFWRLAGAGRSFYTVPSDHYNCPIGSYTHNIPLPEPRAGELPGILTTMTEVGYLRMEEVPGIPVLAHTPTSITYSPLADVGTEPAVVLLEGVPGRLMLLQEAAIRAGVLASLPMLARPTCMAIPAAITHGVVLSSGCIGNRVYTEIGEDTLYAAIPGQALQKLCDQLETIATANATLKEYHEARKAQLASA